MTHDARRRKDDDRTLYHRYANSLLHRLTSAVPQMTLALSAVEGD